MYSIHSFLYRVNIVHSSSLAQMRVQHPLKHVKRAPGRETLYRRPRKRLRIVPELGSSGLAARQPHAGTDSRTPK